MNKIVGVSLGVLVVLITLTLFLSNLSNKKNNSQQVAVTPIPTSVIDSSSSPKSQNLDDTVKNKNQGLLPNQQKELDAFKQKLPYSSPDFDVAYNGKLDTFIVSIKTTNGGEALKDFLAQNSVLDVYLGGSNVFAVGEGTTDNIASRLQEDLFNGREIEEKTNGLESTPPGGKTEQQKDIALLTTMTDNLLNMGKPTPAGESPAGKGNVNYPSTLGGSNQLGYYQMPNPPAGEYVFSSGTCPAQRWGKKRTCWCYLHCLTSMDEKISRFETPSRRPQCFGSQFP
ncbi:hypothetical protein A3G67_01000 [Candidatus Roizmanbacteria bacterium RIFCSPLOWO2_12_FULL_40_12]|uniref:Uncharacterized protein n=1 Tax=Candidatus Roizmanbacteria bacterium RIFCSPLOWO2_01_FULL_40_42 TaxID=1802066 RepID=A0A1F7J1Z3_9BACT|nr:MAG: hypothetical protein A2779_03685 [Candidatus Roizmanbacteria bacterium RIFCSPHIGHO2_01_FULL_40_98]OGK27681.1 MAG: hypothetical protein A3C31_04155 [Candidatus Roizmanbacteria bacterium RIFCSPHIGHO2_02_FULL_40_53]OGK29739.1 MAG: hypothetical protein A2W49_04745 [Candidatus Roizmanbacteria bacterium RIFCSPHIGHO2_12_41_18]OGK37358.1 MAG: hypothetical protein A3E69_04735 [Candidatus Roizmanbacteria bacterium RIFCSPHIGHO2_12_FULL_40_130]OGK49628.1 MAG: hypothetical protein A3B50_04210 [Candi